MRRPTRSSKDCIRPHPSTGLYNIRPTRSSKDCIRPHPSTGLYNILYGRGLTEFRHGISLLDCLSHHGLFSLEQGLHSSASEQTETER